MIYMEVNPIKNLKDIEKIKRYLLKMDNKRNYCLFVVGINVGLRISDLLSLKLNDVFSKDILSKGSHMIVILLLPIVVYFFYADLVVDSVNNYYNELEDSINSWLD